MADPRTPAPAASPGPTLLDLHRAGRLAQEYPRVPALLAGLDDAGLTRAGQLLARLDADDVLALHPATPTMNVAVTGHGTLAPLLAPLTAELARHGLLLRPHLSDFDSYVFDLADPGSDLYRTEPDLVLCVLDPQVVFDSVPVPWTCDDVERLACEKTETVAGLSAACAATSKATLVLNTLPLPRRFTAQLVDHRSRARLGVVWREANNRLLRLTETHPDVVVLDLDPLVAEGHAASEPRLSLYTKAHLSAALLARYAREVGHLARQRAGRTKKALAVDLDGTLWGGILGEDGADGIEAAGGYRGEAHRAFQRVVKQLGAQGVLLTAVSKNDPEPVREVLRHHPDMTLRDDDFVRVVANWRPKHDNLTELAASLNLSVDSFVFVDDSPYECGLVRHELPSVAVVPVNEEPALHIEALLRDGWFDTRELTREDLTRVAKYRDELVRKDFLDSFDSLEEYLRQLQVRVRLSEAGTADVARVSQMTLRTNQFNQTTRRLQPAEVGALLADPAAQVLVVGSADRFGDNGTVGAVFTRRDGSTLHIDNFLLSCRVFSRGIEQAVLAAVLRRARARGVTETLAAYRATPKNAKVKDFYPRNGFARVSGDDAAAVYRHRMTDLPAVPGHVRLTDSNGDGDDNS
ncbi:HAD-superfamily phosphatase, subfamily IIIC:FkbH [Streptomyces lucensis JCM 4490]|uniref:HAD-superfamily phosphatase, subfamily IIIC:FkbH n=1 Tax=Streptomyces lucensis JCM 4490 TaxID=1306176 RepID=A0A918JB02_9ACTN|nr:HAD-IIIC family phosphatase [Streptomyces lucensis]GGW70332.1 HAD-superfamily phosphatase, subfamily IIIC:FkbH [Streptomyces lucensis JCM 4490]